MVRFAIYPSYSLLFSRVLYVVYYILVMINIIVNFFIEFTFSSSNHALPYNYNTPIFHISTGTIVFIC